MRDYKPGDNNLTAKQLVLYINGVSVHEEITAPGRRRLDCQRPGGRRYRPVKKMLPLECFVAKGDSTANALAVKVTYTIAARNRIHILFALNLRHFSGNPARKPSARGPGPLLQEYPPKPAGFPRAPNLEYTRPQGRLR